MEARLVVLDNMVVTQSAGIEKSLGATGLVGAKETGEPPTSSGESGLSSQAGEITLHLWSLTLWSCLGAFEQMVTGLLRNVVAKERDPAVADRVNMTDRKRRLQIQLYYVIALTCGATSFQFRTRGMETVVQSVWAMGFVAISVDAPGPSAVNEIRQFGAGKSAAIKYQNVRKR